MMEPLDDLLRESRGRALGAAIANRDIGILYAVGCLLLALADAAVGGVAAVIGPMFIAAGCALYAVRCQRRFDSILTRSLAAALAEGGDASFAEAA